MQNCVTLAAIFEVSDEPLDFAVIRIIQFVARVTLLAACPAKGPIVLHEVHV